MNTPNPTPDPLDDHDRFAGELLADPKARDGYRRGVELRTAEGIASAIEKELDRAKAAHYRAALIKAAGIARNYTGNRAESSAAGSVVSTEGPARPRPHWTIELGAEEARRWVASEPQMTDAEKDAFRAQVEGSGHPHPHGDDDGHDGYMSTRCEEGRPGCVGRGCICRCHADQPGPGPWTGPRPTLTSAEDRPIDTPEGDTTDGH